VFQSLKPYKKTIYLSLYIYIDIILHILHHTYSQLYIYIYWFTILPRNLSIYRVMLFCMIIDVLFLSTSLSVYSCWVPPDGIAPCQCEVRTDLPSNIYFGANFISSLPWSLFSKRKTGNVAGAVEKFHEMDAQNRYFIGHIASSASNCTEVPNGNSCLMKLVSIHTKQGSLNYPCWGGSNNSKCMVTLMHFPYDSDCLGW